MEKFSTYLAAFDGTSEWADIEPLFDDLFHQDLVVTTADGEMNREQWAGMAKGHEVPGEPWTYTIATVGVSPCEGAYVDSTDENFITTREQPESTTITATVTYYPALQTAPAGANSSALRVYQASAPSSSKTSATWLITSASSRTSPHSLQ